MKNKNAPTFYRKAVPARLWARGTPDFRVSRSIRTFKELQEHFIKNHCTLCNDEECKKARMYKHLCLRQEKQAALDGHHYVVFIVECSYAPASIADKLREASKLLGEQV